MTGLNQLLALPLAPLMLTQAVLVRRKTLVLPEPSGPRTGTSGSGPELSVLIAGDSSAAGVGCREQEQALAGQIARVLGKRYRLTWRVEARTGDRTSDTLERLSRMHRQKFDVAVTALGVNDVTRLTRPRSFQARQSALMRLLTEKFGVRLVLLSGVPPMQRFPALPEPLAWFLGQHAARLDQAMANAAESVAQARHLPFDLPEAPDLAAPDGYHPSARAYTLWAEALSRRIEAEMERITPAASVAPSALNR